MRILNLKRLCPALMMAALSLAGAADARAQGRPADRENNKPKAAESAVAKAAPGGEDPGYVIGAEDELLISVWKESELTRSVPVRPDGKISIPLLNDVQAEGLTPVQLSTLITERLRKFIADPQVTVIVSAINSRRIYIVGEVGRAGAFPMLPSMTVLQALASAGGFTQYADTRKIYVLREEGGRTMKFPFNYKEALKGLRPEQNIKLKPGDTIVVP